MSFLHPGLLKTIPGRHFMGHFVKRRSIIFQLVKRDFQQRYVGSAAGWVWSLIHPLVLLVSYTFIFGYCLGGKPGPGALTDNYALHLFTGMLPWLLFSETVQRSSGSIVEQANLVTKTLFPSEIVPVAIFLSSLIGHTLTVAAVVGIVAILLGHASPMLVMLPIFSLLLGLFAIGIGWVAAALQVYLRDTAQVVAVMLTFWLWLTPIFIGEEKFPPGVHFILKINPLVYVVQAYREMLLGTTMPGLHDLAATLGPMAAFAITTFVIGGLFFRHLKRGFADVL
jgi:ABC-type polysaccharide/polyol phosphate export permease